ncbi:MAG: AMP-binding protein [Dehalococcoidales bacterium]
MDNFASPDRDTIIEYTGGLTISNLWDNNARDHPDRAAIEDSRICLSWVEAKRWIDRVALSLLELGIDRDEVLVVQLANCVELHLLRVVGEKAGIRLVPVTSNMRQVEMKYILTKTEAVGLVIPWEYRGFSYVDMAEEMRPSLPKLKHIFIVGEKVPDGLISIEELAAQPLDQKYPDDYFEERRYRGDELSLIGHTSGSTGLPKLTMYSPETCSAAGKFFMENLKLTRYDTVAAIAPAARGPNLPAYFGAPWAASKIFMLPWSGAKDALTTIEEKTITVACLVPTQLTMMVEEAQARHYDLSSVRVWTSAGAYLPPPLMAEVEEKMGGAVLNNYGSMELGGLTSARLTDSYNVRMTTAGKPIFGVRIKIVDNEGKEVTKGTVGVIMARSLCSSLGFYQDEKATREVWNEEGWASTGDMGMTDKRGDLVITGRQKDIIIRGGQNIYPAEIEALLVDHPNIRDVAVVAMTDQVMGERACAYVVPVEGKTLTFDEMILFLKQKNTAPFKLPERLELIDKFPMVSDEYKVDKKALRQDIIQKLIKEKQEAGK